MNVNKKPDISIIVPIYNVESFLRRCVDSILNQTYRNFELILVDDGSPDDCPTICDEYADQDDRVTVIHKQNGGLSDARNAGIDIAQGKYIGFVDSDDSISPYMYERLIKLLEKSDADIAATGFLNIDYDGNVITEYPKLECEKVYDQLFAVYLYHVELKNEFVRYKKQFRKYLRKILSNPIICRMKKVNVLLMYINKKSAYRLAKKLFPECLPDFLR